MQISGGSGVTPVMSMLRTLCDEGHAGEVAFVHYARTAADWLYQSEAETLAARHPNLKLGYLATREGDGHLSAAAIRELVGDLDGTVAAVCGPPALIDAAREVWAAEGGGPDRVRAETFTPPVLTVSGPTAQGELRFLHSDRRATVGTGTLLEQAEAAGLSPEFGCRMGICHTCTCRKAAGAVRNVQTGETTEDDDEGIHLCISVPAGDVALEN